MVQVSVDSLSCDPLCEWNSQISGNGIHSLRIMYFCLWRVKNLQAQTEWLLNFIHFSFSLISSMTFGPSNLIIPLLLEQHSYITRNVSSAQLYIPFYRTNVRTFSPWTIFPFSCALGLLKTIQQFPLQFISKTSVHIKHFLTSSSFY